MKYTTSILTTAWAAGLFWGILSVAYHVFPNGDLGVPMVAGALFALIYEIGVIAIKAVIAYLEGFFGIGKPTKQPTSG